MNEYPLHWSVFENDIESLKRNLSRTPRVISLTCNFFQIGSINIYLNTRMKSTKRIYATRQPWN